jgi:glucose/mannose-6-phosphate isomerase
MQLDDRAILTAHDPSGMADLTAGFAAQCRQAVEIARKAALPQWSAKPDYVVLTGLGGSAAGGDLVQALFTHSGSVPFLVNRDYAMPAFVGQGALVFACSYSGNTEETIGAYLDARARGASLIVVSSGGKLTEMAQNDGFPVVTVPGGQPPRTALGYMTLPVVVACEKLGLIPEQDWDDVFAALDATAETSRFDAPESRNPAKQLARALHGRMTVLYGLGNWQFAVAQRWRGQLNENSKLMVGTHVFPELCHNEILGWEGAASQGVKEWAAVLLEAGDEWERLRTRVRITTDLIGGAATWHRAQGRGRTVLAKMLSLAHLGDWLSLYLAALAERDPGQMIAIDRLKEELAKIP